MNKIRIVNTKLDVDSSFSIAEKEAKKLDKKKLPPVKHFFVEPTAQTLTKCNVNI